MSRNNTIWDRGGETRRFIGDNDTNALVREEQQRWLAERIRTAQKYTRREAYGNIN